MAETPIEQRWGLKTKISPGPGMVWVGDGVYDSGIGPSGQYESVENLANLAATALPLSAREKLYKQMQKDRGFDNVPIGDMDSFWVKAVIAAQQRQIATGERVSPLEIYDVTRKELLARGAATSSGSGGGSGGGGGPTKAVNLTDPDTANTLLDQALAGVLGRAANKGERAEFNKALRKHELANPSESTDMGDTRVQSGGSNPASFAATFARQQEGSAEFLAATSVVDTLLGSLKEQV